MVLQNAKAWCKRGYSPSEEDITEFFGHVDSGKPMLSAGAFELNQGWIAHYSNPFEYWERGEVAKHSPVEPPAGWIANHLSGESSLVNVMRDYLFDHNACVDTFQRITPAWLKCCEIHQILKGNLLKGRQGEHARLNPDCLKIKPEHQRRD